MKSETRHSVKWETRHSAEWETHAVEQETQRCVAEDLR